MGSGKKRYKGKYSSGIFSKEFWGFLRQKNHTIRKHPFIHSFSKEKKRKTKTNKKIVCHPDFEVETYSKHPAVENIQKLGKELVEILLQTDLLDYELGISISDKSVVLNSDCISDLETTIRGCADSGIHSIHKIEDSSNGKSLVMPAFRLLGLETNISSDYLKTFVGPGIQLQGLRIPLRMLGRTGASHIVLLRNDQRSICMT